MAPSNEMNTLQRRVDTLERNQSDQSKTLTELINEIGELTKIIQTLTTAREVDKVRAQSRNERFDRIEKRLDSISRLGWWILATFGSLVIAAISNLILSPGGINVP